MNQYTLARLYDKFSGRDSAWIRSYGAPEGRKGDDPTYLLAY